MNALCFLFLAAILFSPAVLLCQRSSLAGGKVQPVTVQLPSPQHDGKCSVEKALATRRSIRAFRADSLGIATLSQIVWAAQGMTLPMDAPAGWSWGTWQGGKRTAPSAGALYPLELYVVAGDVDGVKPGVYKYTPRTHQLQGIVEGDKRSALASAALGQKWIEDAPCVFVIAAVYGRTKVKYGERAPRYVHIEAGHAVENICLQAVALDLGTTMVGAFDDDRVKTVIGMQADEQPLAIVPVGRVKR